MRAANKTSKSAASMGRPSLRAAPGSEDDVMGMTWWNGMSQPERHEVLRQADALIRGASVAQAWRLWKANRITMTPPNARQQPEDGTGDVGCDVNIGEQNEQADDHEVPPNK